jgi:hypothetical protein
MASAAIANRIKPILSSLISEDQTGFILGQYLGNNDRLIYDLINFTEQNGRPAMLLFIDFATDFDSISWQFMSKVLDFL